MNKGERPTSIVESMSYRRDRPRAKKSLGQNFLTDASVIDRIISAVGPEGTDYVIEIGPGLGALTEGLVDRVEKLVAIELDRELTKLLRQRFGTKLNFTIMEANALEVDLSALASTAEVKFKLVANLPYYISTAILQHLSVHRSAFTSLVLMFQREVVERIIAPPGDSDRGYLTVLTESAFTAERLFDVPPDAFSPRPKIWSSVVRLVPKPADDLDHQVFEHLVSRSFAEKRKTIYNNLKDHFAEAGEILDLALIDRRRRAETLTIDEWFRLTDGVHDRQNAPSSL